jgi:hypothetical protein
MTISDIAGLDESLRPYAHAAGQRHRWSDGYIGGRRFSGRRFAVGGRRSAVGGA